MNKQNANKSAMRHSNTRIGVTTERRKNKTVLPNVKKLVYNRENILDRRRKNERHLGVGENNCVRLRGKVSVNCLLLCETYWWR